MSNRQDLENQIEALEQSINEEMPKDELYDILVKAYYLQKDIITLIDIQPKSTEEDFSDKIEALSVDLEAIKTINNRIRESLTDALRLVNTSLDE